MTPEEIINDMQWPLSRNPYSGKEVVEALDAAGYVIVPKEPNETQLHKGYLSAVECMAGGCAALEVARNIYSAMTVAAQTQKGQPPG